MNPDLHPGLQCAIKVYNYLLIKKNTCPKVTEFGDWFEFIAVYTQKLCRTSMSGNYSGIPNINHKVYTRSIFSDFVDRRLSKFSLTPQCHWYSRGSLFGWFVCLIHHTTTEMFETIPCEDILFSAHMKVSMAMGYRTVYFVTFISNC